MSFLISGIFVISFIIFSCPGCLVLRLPARRLQGLRPCERRNIPVACGYPRFLYKLYNIHIELVGRLRKLGVYKARPVAFPCLTQERKLGKRLSSSRSLPLSKGSFLPSSSGKTRRLTSFFAIYAESYSPSPRSHPRQNEIALAYFGNLLPFNRNTCKSLPFEPRQSITKSSCIR